MREKQQGKPKCPLSHWGSTTQRPGSAFNLKNTQPGRNECLSSRQLTVWSEEPGIQSASCLHATRGFRTIRHPWERFVSTQRRAVGPRVSSIPLTAKSTAALLLPPLRDGSGMWCVVKNLSNRDKNSCRSLSRFWSFGPFLLPSLIQALSQTHLLWFFFSCTKTSVQSLGVWGCGTPPNSYGKLLPSGSSDAKQYYTHRATRFYGCLLIIAFPTELPCPPVFPVPPAPWGTAPQQHAVLSTSRPGGRYPGVSVPPKQYATSTGTSKLGLGAWERAVDASLIRPHGVQMYELWLEIHKLDLLENFNGWVWMRAVPFVQRPVNICSSTFDSQFTMKRDSFIWRAIA